jgi:hypothetical protein
MGTPRGGDEKGYSLVTGVEEDLFMSAVITNRLIFILYMCDVGLALAGSTSNINGSSTTAAEAPKAIGR